MKGRVLIKCSCGRRNRRTAVECSARGCGRRIKALAVKNIVLEYPDPIRPGRKIRESLGPMGRISDADTVLAVRIADMAAGKLVHGMGRRLRLGEILRRYVKDPEVGKLASLADRVGRLRVIIERLGNPAAGALSKALVRDYRRERSGQRRRTGAGKGRSKALNRLVMPATINREVAYLSAMMAWAAREEIVERNPLVGLEALKGEERRDRVCSAAERLLILKQLEGPRREQARTIFELLYHLPMRLGELVALQWAWVDLGIEPCGGIEFPEGVSKSGRARFVPLIHPHLRPMLAGRETRWGGGAVFAKRAGGGAPATVQAGRTISHAIRRAGIEGLRVHDLKHTAYTNMMISGLPEWLVQYIADHAGPKMGRHYLNLKRHHIMEELTPMMTPLVKPQEEGA